jgi:preprotein translocase subunit YajC
MNSILDFFINTAQANTEATATAANNSMALPIMLVFFVFFLYLTVWRPQNKRAKEQKEMMNGLAQGDEVVTIGGIMGTIVKLTDMYVVLSLNSGVEVTCLKSAIANALPKGTLKSI